MTNILIDQLPESVVIEDEIYPVDWGYRAMILIEICMFDNRWNEEQRMLNALNIFYQGNIPSSLGEALKGLMWFYRCGKPIKKNEKKKGASKKQTRRCYCFDQDAPYIYAAFLTQYRMDLNDTRNHDLHWWKFHAMFEAFSEDLKISKIMYYRSVDVSGFSKNQRRFLNEMKKLYALETDDQNLDDRMRLAKRNADMKAYVRRRMLTAYGNENAES